MEGLIQVFNTLLSAYGKRNWWPAQSPYEMMVGAILTQNTAWTNVEKAISNFGDRLSPEFVSITPAEEIAVIIRSSGYHNQKAIKLKALTEWFGKYAFDIDKVTEKDGEALREELLAIKGIGPETAYSILTYALGKPFFVVDAYTKRILYRLGYEIPATYEGLRLNIEKGLKTDLYMFNEFHALIVEHAKRSCKKTPSCEGCTLKMICQKRF